MKNLFTIVCTLLLITATAFAQEAEHKVLRPDQVNLNVDKPILLKPVEPTNTSAATRTAPIIPNGTPMVDAVTSFKIGEASNAFTFISTEANQIVTAPGVGTGNGSVAFVHRHNIGECGGTTFDNGRLRYSVSTDGGLNWNVGGGVSVNSTTGAPTGHCFGNGEINPIFSFRGRFPNIAFHAPGTAASDLNLVGVAPVLSPGAIGGGAYFDGNLHNYIDDAAATPFTPAQITQEEYLDQGGDQLLANSLAERVTGEYWYVNRAGDGVGNVINGINVNKGAYDASDNEIKWAKIKTFSPDYSNHYLNLNGSFPLNPQIAWSPDGTTGYIAFLTDLKGGSDSTFSIGWMESVDGGVTWSNPAEFNIRQFPELIEHINFFTDSVGNPLGTGIPTTAFDFDLVVDGNNNPHVFAVVGNGLDYSIQSGLKMSIFDFTKDQFGDWNMAFVDDQGTFRWDWDVDAGAADPWMQASRTPDGDYVYVSWTDTDTTGNFGDGDNDQPNMIMWGMNVNTFMTTAPTNFTFDDLNWAGRAFMPKIAPVCFENGTTHTIPAVVMDAPAGGLNPCFFWYFSDVTFDAGTDFTDPAEFFYNCNQNPFTNTINELQPDCGVGNGSLSVTVGGGIGPYTYAWDAAAGASVNDTVAGLSAGIYSVTVTDSAGCTDVQDIILNNANAPVLTIDPTSITAITCAGINDGAATVTATGGTGTLSYLWSNGETAAAAVALSPGQSTVTVTDANTCASLIDVTITEPAVLNVALDSNDVSCFGVGDGIIAALASGGTGLLSFQWDDPTNATSSVVSGVGPGTYTVIVTDQNNCTSTQSIIVNEPVALAIGASATPNLNTSPPYTGTATASASGGTAPYEYSWTYTNCDTVEVTQTGAFIFLLPAADYIITVTDVNSCATVDTVAVSGEGCETTTGGVGIDDELTVGINSLSLYPNPNNGTFTVEMTLDTRDDVRLSVLDSRGKLITSRRAENATNFEETFNLSELASGVYLLRVETSKGAVARRLVVQ